MGYYFKPLDLGWLVIHIGEGTGTPLQYSCLENPMDGGAWWAEVHGVVKSRTRLSDFTFTFHFPALEKEVATHSSVPAWGIPGTGEPGGLPSLGSHRVGHDWSDLAAAAVIHNWHTNTCDSLLMECIIRSSGRSKKYIFKAMIIFKDPEIWCDMKIHKVTVLLMLLKFVAYIQTEENVKF